MTATDPAALYAGAMRADQAAEDWRAKVRADVDQLVAAGVVDAAIAGDFAEQVVHDIEGMVDDAPACGCPDGNGYCREDCAHCAGLPDSAPCPGDVVDVGDDDAASWTPPAIAVAAAADPAPVQPLTTAQAEALAGERTDPSRPGTPAQEDFAPASLELAPPAGNPAVSGPGWASRHDPASRAFAAVDRLAGKAPLRDVWLPATPVLDQGKEGACVGFGVADAVNVLRVQASHGESVPLLTDADALNLYHQAQRVDDVPGESYTGTSVLAGMKAGQAAGDFGGYLWDFGTSAIAQTLMQLHAPVVVGVPWFEAMYETGPGGLVVLGGKRVGGHCLCIVGLTMKGPQGQAGPFFIWRNSWGEGYGVHGDGWVHHRDLATLLAGQGEAAVPTAQPQVAK